MKTATAQQHLTRDRLHSTLVQAVNTHPLVVLCAPPGFGKSVCAAKIATLPSFCAVRANFSQKNTTPALKPLSGTKAEIPPDKAAGIPALSPTGILLDALARADKRLAKLFRQCVLASADDGEAGEIAAPLTPEKEAIFHAALRDLAAEKPLLFVLDGFDSVEGSPLAHVWLRLCSAGLSGVHVLLLCRKLPKWPLDVLHSRQHVAIFHQDALAFTKAETIQFFFQCGIPNTRLIANVWRLCEGWPLAVRLMAECVMKKKEMALAVSICAKIVAQTVFTPLEEDRITDLVMLGVLGAFTLRQAQICTGNSEVGELLEEMRRENRFILYSAVDNRHRIHVLLRLLLLNLLQKNTRINKSALYTRAGDIFLSTGNREEAIQCFHRSGRKDDEEKILQIFERPGAHLLFRETPDLLAGAIHAIPETVLAQYPLGYCVFICHYLFRMGLPAASRFLHTLPGILAVEGKKKSALYGPMPLPLAPESPLASPPPPPAPDEAVNAQIAGLCALMETCSQWNSIKKMHEILEQYAQSPGAAVVAQPPEGGWAFGCPHLGFSYIRTEKPYAEQLLPAQNLADLYSRVTGVPSEALRHTLHGEMLLENALESDCLQRAEAALQEGGAVAARSGRLPDIVANTFARARLALFTSDVALARKTLETMPHRELLKSLPHSQLEYDMALGYIFAATGDMSGVPYWLRAGVFSSVNLLPPAENFAKLVYGKVLLRSKKFNTLNDLSVVLHALFSASRQTLGLVHTLFFRAAAIHHREGQSKAAPWFAEALILAKANNALLPLVEYGSSFLLLADAFVDAGPVALPIKMRPRFGQLVELITMMRKKASDYTTLEMQAMPPLTVYRLKFTRREQAVAPLLLAGKTIPEMAAMLGMGKEAVKKVLLRLYKKIGAHNMHEARDSIRKLGVR